MKNELEAIYYNNRPLSVELDLRDGRGGNKVWSWIKKGIPIRVEIGKKELETETVFVGRRDRGHRDKQTLSRKEFVAKITNTLNDIQKTIFEKARKYRDENLARIRSKDDFYDFFTSKNKEKPEIHGGFALCHWNGDPGIEEKLKNELGVTIRCIPMNLEQEEGRCVISGEPGKHQVVFAKAY